MGEPRLTELLDGAPTNWGRWGQDDEIGALNLLTPEVVAEAVGVVRSGKVFTLGTPFGSGADPVWPGRAQTQRFNTLDRGQYVSGKATPYPGGFEYADDFAALFLQGSTHCDALGHAWYDGKLYNGYDASTTVGGLDKASIAPIAEHGIVGRGVLVDVARHRGKDVLDKGETIELDDLLACAEAQGVEVQPRSILLVRTGLIPSYFRRDPDEYFADYVEPGLSYSPELVDWFRDNDIVALGSDTMGNEVTIHSSGCVLPLHAALMRNLGVAFVEILSLDELAEDCASDGRYEFLYVAAPLKVVRGTGAPINPIAIK